MALRLLLLAMLAFVAACGFMSTPPPATPVPSVGPSPSPVATPLAGSAELQVIGAAREPCIPPPSGCGYGVTLLVPGGDSYHAEFVPAVEGGPLLADIGLPASLPPGSYAVAFETIQVSDELREDASGEMRPGATGVVDRLRGHLLRPVAHDVGPGARDLRRLRLRDPDPPALSRAIGPSV